MNLLLFIKYIQLKLNDIENNLNAKLNKNINYYLKNMDARNFICLYFNIKISSLLGYFS